MFDGVRRRADGLEDDPAVTAWLATAATTARPYAVLSHAALARCA